MKSRYWLSCVRRGIPRWVVTEAFLGVRHSGIGHWLAVFLTRALARIWRDGEAILFTGIIDPSEGGESRLRTVGCVVRLAC